VLKQLRLSAVDPVHARLFHETFPSFFATVDLPENSADMKQQIESLGPKFRYVEQTDLPRRFAGEPTLRRGCYFTVCRSISGEDDGTLRNEVRAYRDPLVSGRVDVLDLRLVKNPFTGEHANALFICWFSPAQSRLAQELLKSQSRSDTQQVFALEFPYDVMEVVLDRVIDLRYPQVRKWFYETFSTEQQDGTIAWIAGRKLATALEPHRRNVEALCISRPSRFRVESQVPPVPTCFAKMLPTLMNPDLGGGSAADSGSSLQAIGTWLRQNGVAALIYPSARTDVSVEIVNGEIAVFSGWNLVDYRNDRPPANIKLHYFEQSPWCWTDFSPGIHFEGDTGGLGSFKVTGVETYWNRDYKGMVSALDSCEMHCRREMIFNKDAVLTVIGAWRLGEVSIEWLRKNAVDKDEKGARQAYDFFRGILIRLKERQKAGLVDELAATLPRTQNMAQGITECMNFVDDLAKSLVDGGSPHAAATLIVSNRLHVLKFYVSLHALALRVGWSVDRQPGTGISRLVNDGNIYHTGLSRTVQEAIAVLFQRGIALMEPANIGTKPELSQFEEWMKDLEAVKIGKGYEP